MALYLARWASDNLIKHSSFPPIQGQRDIRFNSIFQTAYPPTDLLGALSSYPYKFKQVRPLLKDYKLFKRK